MDYSFQNEIISVRIRLVVQYGSVFVADLSVPMCCSSHPVVLSQFIQRTTGSTVLLFWRTS
jgi:hypothetical protein